MNEKEKNKGKPSKSRFSASNIFLLFVFASGILALLYLSLSIYDYIFERFQAECFDLHQAVAWTGVIEFRDAPESEILITEANASRISLLGTATFDEEYEVPRYNVLVLRHPLHNYILTLQQVRRNFRSTTSLVVCSEHGQVIQILTDNVYFMAFSANGRYFAAENWDKGQIEIYNAYTFELEHVIEHGGDSAHFAFHPTEPLLAWSTNAIGYDPLNLWNYETQELVAEFPLRGAPVRFLAFNEQGTLLLVAIRYHWEANPVWGIAPE